MMVPAYNHKTFEADVLVVTGAIVSGGYVCEEDLKQFIDDACADGNALRIRTMLDETGRILRVGKHTSSD